MNGYLKQSTASQVRTIGPFVDDTDFKTLENALTIANTDILLKKNGAASAAKNSGGATADGSGGMYHLTLDATDSATVGELFFSVKVAGALVVFGSFCVLEEAVYDALFAASAPGYLQPTVAARTLDVSAGGEAGVDWANIGSPTTAQNLSATNIDPDQVVASVSGAVGSVTGAVGSVTGLTAADVGAIKAKTDNLPTDPADQSLVIAATDAIVTAVGTRASQASLDVIDGIVDDILLDTAEIGTAGAGLTNIDLPNQTMNITGNITGNVSGSVGSVTGAVGSVTAGVTLAASAVQAIWDALTSALTTAGSIGKRIADFLTGDAFARLGAPAGASVSADIADLPTNAELATSQAAADDATLAAIAALNNLSAAQVNTEVDTALADIHLDHLLAVDYDPASQPGVATALLNELIESDAGVSRYTANALEQAPTGGSAPTVGQIADGVWDELLSGHVVSGSSGEALAAAGTAGDPWTTALPGAYGAGTAGKIVGDNVNATIGSRSTQASVDTVDGIVDAILVDTAEIGAAGAGLTAIDLPNQTMNITGNITGNLSGSVGSVTGAVGSVTAGVTLAASAVQAIWDALTSALTTVGSIGKLLVDNVNATISSRSSHSAADVWAAGTRTLTSFGTLAADVWASVARTLTAATNITSTGGTTVPQTGDSFARLGAPAGASHSADTAAVKVDTAAIKLKTDNLSSDPADQSAVEVAVDAAEAAILAALPTANANADALLDRSNGVETSLTLRGALRLIVAANAGKLSGAATTTIVIRNVGDSKDRITATVDVDGNRSAVTTDAT